MTDEEIWGPNDPPSDTPSEPPMAVYCPGCGAYLLTLGLLGKCDCELCGEVFEVLERKGGRVMTDAERIAQLTADRDEWRRRYESLVATLSAYCNSATNPATHQVVFNVLRKHGERT